ncbi:thiamine diphosphokinase [Bacteroides pyogenes F0041]|uniref:Thiamine diphosphokinase n=1 Tax=Bacteroides pyogenes F0041 TaxID=1321819 RepID=U2BUT2_9BACE|nr:thiamine diphosphokinase [Bacteroides pyogenes]ERI81949.1 thiamine diphosphokinase [Bacteroides pyogenes F0041]
MEETTEHPASCSVTDSESVDLKPEAVILANGEYPVHPLPLRILAEAKFTVCCDGAADEYIAQGKTPDIIIGDGDSLSPENKERFASIIHYVSDQETNDQTKAVRYLRQRGFRRITIVGATGKREDHTLGNISLLIEYMRSGMDVRMVTDYGIFVPARGTRRFAAQPGQQISIFSFGASELQAEGLAYPLSDFNNWWQGTLNQAKSAEFTIRCQGDYLVFLAFCREKDSHPQ